MIDDPVSNQIKPFEITDTNRYVPVIFLSSQDNAKLLQHLKSDIKRTLDWKNHRSKVIIEKRNSYLDFLIDPSCAGVNRLFVLLCQYKTGRASYKQYLSFDKKKTKDCNKVK